jgi:hypothetical protein
MAYRAVRANKGNEILAIGMDEGQGGRDYNGVGVWLDWTFDEIPQPPQEVLDQIAELHKQGLRYERPVVRISDDGKGFVYDAAQDVETKIDAAITDYKSALAAKR